MLCRKRIICRRTGFQCWRSWLVLQGCWQMNLQKSGVLVDENAVSRSSREPSLVLTNSGLVVTLQNVTTLNTVCPKWLCMDRRIKRRQWEYHLHLYAQGLPPTLLLTTFIILGSDGFRVKYPRDEFFCQGDTMILSQIFLRHFIGHCYVFVLWCVCVWVGV